MIVWLKRCVFNLDLNRESVSENMQSIYLTTNLYIFYEFRTTSLVWFLYDLSKPQWWVGLGAGFGVGHSYKITRIGNS